MSNLIFALEDDALDALNEPQPYDSNVDAMVGGIEAAMESLQALQKLKAAFQKQKNRKPSKSSIKIGMLAMERIKDSVGIFDGQLIVAQECFTEDSVSVEGISDIMRSIWDAIVRTFQAVWDAITRLFSSSTDSKTKKQAKDSYENVKSAVKSGKSAKSTENKNDNTDVKSDDGSFLLPYEVSQPFRYIGEDPRLTDLKEEALKLLLTVKIVEGTIQNLQVCNVNVQDFIQKMRHREIKPDDYSGVHQAMGFFQSYLIDHFDKGGEAEILEYIKQSYPDQVDNVDRTSLRTLNGLTRGNVVTAFMYDLRGDDTNIYIDVRQKPKAEGSAKIRVMDSSEAVSYCEINLDLTTKTLDMMDHFNRDVGKIIGSQKAMLAGLKDLFKMYGEESGDDYKLVIQFAQAVTSSMSKFMKDMSRIVRAVEVSALDHNRVAGAISRAYGS